MDESDVNDSDTDPTDCRQWEAEGCARLVVSAPRLDVVRLRVKPIRPRAELPPALLPKRDEHADTSAAPTRRSASRVLTSEPTTLPAQ